MRAIPLPLRLLFVTLALGLAGCSSMLGPDRSARVVIQPSPVAGTSPLLTGPTEKELTTLLARYSYRYSNRQDAAWIAYVDQRPSVTNPSATTYVLTKIVRNPRSRHIVETPRDPSGTDGWHPSLSMLGGYERAEQARSATR